MKVNIILRELNTTSVEIISLMTGMNDLQLQQKEVPLSPGEKQKIVLLGNQRVGKTSIIFRLHSDTFNTDYNVLLGDKS